MSDNKEDKEEIQPEDEDELNTTMDVSPQPSLNIIKRPEEVYSPTRRKIDLRTDGKEHDPTPIDLDTAKIPTIRTDPDNKLEESLQNRKELKELEEKFIELHRKYEEEKRRAEKEDSRAKYFKDKANALRTGSKEKITQIELSADKERQALSSKLKSSKRMGFAGIILSAATTYVILTRFLGFGSTSEKEVKNRVEIARTEERKKFQQKEQLQLDRYRESIEQERTDYQTIIKGLEATIKKKQRELFVQTETYQGKLEALKMKHAEEFFSLGLKKGKLEEKIKELEKQKANPESQQKLEQLADANNSLKINLGINNEKLARARAKIEKYESEIEELNNKYNELEENTFSEIKRLESQKTLLQQRLDKLTSLPNYNPDDAIYTLDNTNAQKPKKAGKNKGDRNFYKWKTLPKPLKKGQEFYRWRSK